jgi:hypothetical protein
MGAAALPAAAVAGSLRRMDVTSIEGALDRLGESLEEARAATQLLRDGDYSAVADLNEVVDGMAMEIAELKSKTGASF